MMNTMLILICFCTDKFGTNVSFFEGRKYKLPRGECVCVCAAYSLNPKKIEPKMTLESFSST